MNFNKDAFELFNQVAETLVDDFAANRFLSDKLTLDGFPTTDIFFQPWTVHAVMLEEGTAVKALLIFRIGS